jgi:hypothetical protein
VVHERGQLLLRCDNGITDLLVEANTSVLLVVLIVPLEGPAVDISISMLVGGEYPGVIGVDVIDLHQRKHILLILLLLWGHVCSRFILLLLMRLIV